MRNWMNSPGHRASILSDQFTHTGIGVAEEGGQVYATQDFGELVAVLEGEAPKEVPFGSELTLRFRFLGRFAQRRLTVFVHFPDTKARVYLSGGRYYTGAGPYEPAWEGDRFTIKILCDKGRGIYNLTMGKDGRFYPEGLRFEVR
ncbi:MAG: CAP domain-containing protein [Candidatus Latescibacteria bacterium]|nr:CAP domain-containing protein [Candidatus Latescibacterota bacterium]